MSEPNHYETLGVKPGADFAEIKKAYRRLAKLHHPDRIANPTPEQQRLFARIAEAYAVLSTLDKRRAYDDSLFARRAAQQAVPGRDFTRRHYSGYPYFQYDIVTPYLHAFFIPRSENPRTHREMAFSILFNWRTLLVAIAGALYFFKFFAAYDGTVTDKKMEAGLFNNISNYVFLKNADGEEKKRRVKDALYDILKPGDRVFKERFSMTVAVNEQIAVSVEAEQFVLQTALIYVFISGVLFFFEYARK